MVKAAINTGQTSLKLDYELELVKVLQVEIKKLIANFLSDDSNDSQALKQALLKRCNKLLVEILYTENREIFEKQLEQLKKIALLLAEKATPLNSTADIQCNKQLILDQCEVLKNNRIPQLKKKYAWRDILRRAFWIGGGFALLVASTVFAFAFPAMGIPIFWLAVGGVGYGLVDFSQRISEEFSKSPKKATDPLLKQIQDVLHISDEEFAPIIDSIVTQNQKYDAQKEWFKRLNYAACISGLLFAAGGLAVLFFPIGIPLFAMILITVVNVGVTLWGEQILYQKVMTEEEQVDAILKRINQEEIFDTSHIEKNYKRLASEKTGGLIVSPIASESIEEEDADEEDTDKDERSNSPS